MNHEILQRLIGHVNAVFFHYFFQQPAHKPNFILIGAGNKHRVVGGEIAGRNVGVKEILGDAQPFGDFLSD